jgi:mannitol/fructose-specific phosphotransferase system IIA component (Ntr-type)
VCVIVSLLRPRRADLKMMFAAHRIAGLMPFRRLLLIENIIDMGDLKVRDAMRRCGGVRVCNWTCRGRKSEIDQRHALLPLSGDEREGGPARGRAAREEHSLCRTGFSNDTRAAQGARPPALEMLEDLPLEEALALFQRHYRKMAIVTMPGHMDRHHHQRGRSGGNRGPHRRRIRCRANGGVHPLADALSPGRVILDLQATSMKEAIREIIAAIPPADLPADRQVIIRRAGARTNHADLSRQGTGHSARPAGRLDKPVLIFARCAEGIPQDRTTERADLIFLLLTPSGMARIQPRLLADIVGLIDSEYVTERLRKAETPEEIIEAIRAGQQVVLD